MNARSKVAGGSRAYATALRTYKATIVASGRESPWTAIRCHPFQQVLDQILEHRGVELVVDLLSVSFRRDQTGVFQDAEMPRDGWPARVEPRRDLAGGPRRRAEEPEDLATGRVRQGAKNGVPHLH